jgi:hypothetical protein
MAITSLTGLLSVTLALALYWVGLVIAELILDYERVSWLLFFSFHLLNVGSALTLVEWIKKCARKTYYFFILLMGYATISDIASTTEHILFSKAHGFTGLSIAILVFWCLVVIMDVVYFITVLDKAVINSDECPIEPRSKHNKVHN